MKLRYKTIFIILLLFTLITISEFIIQRLIIFPAFLELEKNEAQNNMNRVTEALENEISHLDTLCNDWATWDDTYDFIDTLSEDYIHSNLPDQIFYESGLSVIYIFDSEKKVVWGQAFDIAQGKEVYINELSSDSISDDHPLLLMDDQGENLADMNRTGLFNTDKGPLLAATELILTSQAEGPSKGFFLMGILLNDEIIDKISIQTKVSFEIIDLYDNSDKSTYKSVIAALENNSLFIEKNKTDTTSTLYSYYYNIENRPGLLIKIVFPRSISIQGLRIIKNAAFSTIISGLIVLLFVLIFLNKYIINPISLLDKSMLKIIKTNDFSIRLSSERKDEIGELYNGFDFFITKIQKQTELLENLSTVDSLTNIANRRKFDEILQMEWNRHKRYKSTITLMLIDIDYFKKYNDYYGHQAGDDCLKKIGQLLSNQSRRAGEFTARYGGEEFVFLLSNSNREQALNISDRLVSELKKINILHEKSDIAEFVTFSIGIAIYKPDQKDNSAILIRMADEALYKAKEQGRNRAVLYSPGD